MSPLISYIEKVETHLKRKLQSQDEKQYVLSRFVAGWHSRRVAEYIKKTSRNANMFFFPILMWELPKGLMLMIDVVLMAICITAIYNMFKDIGKNKQ
ncbi:MAG: hypothetical protein GY804_11510 [Alphaproteobacteria bacterium]|nr:hypothetical protein [Alphaproteobacteria bacterium]